MPSSSLDYVGFLMTLVANGLESNGFPGPNYRLGPFVFLLIIWIEKVLLTFLTTLS